MIKFFRLSKQHPPAFRRHPRAAEAGSSGGARLWPTETGVAGFEKQNQRSCRPLVEITACGRLEIKFRNYDEVF